MISVFKKKLSLRSASKELSSASTSSSFDISHDKKSLQAQNEELRRENEQLRRELEDANTRIRELKNSLLVFITNNDDDASVEVQSVDLSITSSTTTLPTGSAPSLEERAKQEQRDEKRLENWRNAGRQPAQKKKLQKFSPMPSWSSRVAPLEGRDPTIALNTSTTKLLETLFESDSDCSQHADDEMLAASSVSDMSESDISEAKVREALALSIKRGLDRPDSLSAMTAGYFTRGESIYSELSSSVGYSHSESFGEI